MLKMFCLTRVIQAWGIEKEQEAQTLPQSEQTMKRKPSGSPLCLPQGAVEAGTESLTQAALCESHKPAKAISGTW